MRLAILLALIPGSARAYYYQCNTHEISSFVDGCPVGSLVTGSCGCDAAANTPRLYPAQLSFSVESQGSNGVTAAQLQNAASAAAASWNAAGTAARVKIAGSFEPTDARYGGSNAQGAQEIFLVATEEEWIALTGAGAGTVLGVTQSLSWSPSGACDKHVIYDADILINGFSADSVGGDAIQRVIAHEMGHALGLGHPCLTDDAACAAPCDALMAAAGTRFSAPTAGDVAALSALYSAATRALGAPCGANSDCDSGLCLQREGLAYCSEACGACSQPAGYECIDGACRARRLPGRHEECRGPCRDDRVCLTIGDEEYGHCFDRCAPAATDQCLADTTCVEYAAEKGYCKPASSEFGVCGGTTGLTCHPESVCLKVSGVTSCRYRCSSDGTLCPQPNGDHRVCVVYASPKGYCELGSTVGGLCGSSSDEGRRCVDGLHCLTLGGESSCFTDCTDDRECAGNFDCNRVSDTKYYCRERGAGGEGDACASTTTDCQKNHRCISTGTELRCAAECQVDTDCSDASQTCLELSSSAICWPLVRRGGENEVCPLTEALCYPRCEPGAGACAAGESCVEFGASGYCKAAIPDGDVCAGVVSEPCLESSLCLKEGDHTLCRRSCAPGSHATCGPNWEGEGRQACIDYAADKGYCGDGSDEGDPCGPGSGRVCHDGNVCLTVADETACRRSCTPGADGTCAADQTCLEYGSEGKGYCTAAAEEGEGCAAADDRVCRANQVCLRVDADTLCRRSCDPGTSGCADGRPCLAYGDGSKGYCAPAASVGALCGGDTGLSCYVGNRCVSIDTGAPSRCYPDCTGSDACAGNNVCTELGSGNKYCRPRGTASEGQVCASSNDCLKGQRCLDVDGQGRCALDCSLRSDCSGQFQLCEEIDSGARVCAPTLLPDGVAPGNQRVCLDVDGARGCFDRCIPGSVGCGAGLVCVGYGDVGRGYCAPAAADGAACLGDSPNGAQCGAGSLCLDHGAGLVCRRDCSAGACAAGFECTSFNGGSYCQPAISNGSPCGADGPPGERCYAASTCIRDGEGEALCRRMCTPGASQCPSNRTCVAVAGGGFCAPAAPEGAQCLGDSGQRCFDGHTCILEEDGVRRCRKDCAPGTSCGPANVCVPLAEGGYCALAHAAGEGCLGALPYHCATGIHCLDNLCYTDCAAGTCQGNFACKAAADARYCHPRGDVREGQECATSDDCQAGNRCVTEGERLLCARECEGSGDCLGGAQTCEPIEGSAGSSRCSPADPSNTQVCFGEDGGAPCFDRCIAGGTTCGAGWTCQVGSDGVRGFCIEVKDAGAVCDPDKVRQSQSACVDGYACSRVGEEAEFRCRRACAPATERADCGTLQRCLAYASGEAFCVAGSAELAPCAEDQPCLAGLECIRKADSGEQICRRQCTVEPETCLGGLRCRALADNAGVCADLALRGQACADREGCIHGLSCLGSGDDGDAFCQQLCTPGGDACPGGLCKRALVGGGEERGYCVGAAAIGEPCTSESPCQEGLLCLLAPGEADSLCYADCSEDDLCGETAQCVPLGAGDKAYCQPRGLGAPGDVCVRSADCLKQHLCVAPGQGDIEGFLCLRGCDEANACLRDFQTCVELGSGESVCFPLEGPPVVEEPGQDEPSPADPTDGPTPGDGPAAEDPGSAGPDVAANPESAAPAAADIRAGCAGCQSAGGALWLMVLVGGLARLPRRRSRE
jgi:hypothetical protein